MKDWIGNKNSTYAQLGASNHSEQEREINDYYATDPRSLEIFLYQLRKDNVKLHKDIWENACGGGNLSKILKAQGYNVKSTDLINRNYGTSGIDFLKTNEIDLKTDILTNPPYKYAQEFVEHSLKTIADNYYVIMYLKIQFLEGKKRKRLYKQQNLKYVYVNSERQICAINNDFKNIKSSASCYCWFIWQKGYKGEPIIRWI